MSTELIAERTVTLPAGTVRLTLARHDDGHYSGVAALVHSGQRVGLLEAGPRADNRAPLTHIQVDTAAADGEVGTALEQLLGEATAAEAAEVRATQGPDAARAAA